MNVRAKHQPITTDSMKCSLFKILMLALCCSVCTTTRAQSKFIPQHEFRLGWGLAPITCDSGISGGCDAECYYPEENYFGEYFYATHRSNPGRTTHALNFIYIYKPLRFMDVGVQLSYVGYYQNFVNVSTERVDAKTRNHHIGITPTLRFTYLNKEYVRLYSGIGIGLKINRFKNYRDAEYGNSRDITFQLTGFGISVGKTLFGFTEFGIGSIGLVNVGIGYRFNAVKHK